LLLLDECNGKILALQQRAGVEEKVLWFRAPHGKYTRQMEEVLNEKGMTNTMCDTYASCPIVEDGKFIGDFLPRRCSDGSIILLHMPELGHREWCMDGLRGMLEGLKQRGFKVVSVGELSNLAAPP